MSLVETSVEHRVALVTLHRPERLNAYTAELGLALFSAIERFDLDDDVRAIVVTGAGRAFCAGADLAAGASTFAGDDTFRIASEVERRVWPGRRHKPVIAAINGPAVGIGATLPLQWDLRFASDRARIGFVFVRRGIVPEAGSTWLLPRLVGLAQATEMMVSGRIMDAGECLSRGLVSRVVPHEELLPMTLAFARELAEQTAPVAVAATLRLLHAQLSEPEFERGKADEDAVFHRSGKSVDAAEGVTAFLEKRLPRWTGRPTAELPTWELPVPRDR